MPREARRDPAPDVAPSPRVDALADASSFGMIGLLGQGTSRVTSAGEFARGAGADDLAISGELWGRLTSEAWGWGDLALTGVGEGGGGTGEGIGIGQIGTLGHTYGPPGWGLGGEGSKRLKDTHRVRSYICRGYGCSISGRLPAEIIRRIVRQNFGRFRACYEAGLVRNPALAGTVSARFVIGRDGAISNVGLAGSTLPDADVTSCVVRGFYGISFPVPDGGIVFVTYPIAFSPE
jgi:hypothetical protein